MIKGLFASLGLAFLFVLTAALLLPQYLVPLLILGVVLLVAMKRPVIAAMVGAMCFAVLFLGPLAVVAQDAAAAAPAGPAPLEDLGNVLWGMIPAKYLVYAGGVSLVLSVGSRLAELTPTDIDDKAFTFLGRLFNLLGGHWTKLNGDANKKS